MKILLLDSIPDYSPSIEKEGSQLLIALSKLGYDVKLTGKGHPDRLRDLPAIARDFDVCLLTDNYPERWEWNTFKRIKVPKAFWAIDSHIRRFDFVVKQDFQVVLFNCFTHIDRFLSDVEWQKQLAAHSWFPYAVDPEFFASIDGTSRYRTEATTQPQHELVFCGHMDLSRARAIRDFEELTRKKVTCLIGYGQDYIDNILSGTLNLNFPTGDGFNAKILQTLALGKMLLSNRNVNSAVVVPDRFGIYFSDIAELRDKVHWLLDEPHVARRMGQQAKAYLLAHHTWEHRARRLVEVLQQVL